MKNPQHLFAFGSRQLDLSEPHVMGILNLTPDSFSDGGELFAGGKPDLARVLRRAEAMVQAGAAFLDVGGESTRPGATPISSQEEMDRVLPVLEALQQFPVILSVDTSNPELMRESIKVGAGLINDVRALERPGALLAVAAGTLPVCLMHMQGQPLTMQERPAYEDVTEDVMTYLRGRIEACERAGISRTRLLVDPGFGFGKNLQHNLHLLKYLDELQSLELPILVGLSRKRMLGAVTGKAEKERVVAGVAAAVIAVMKGTSIVRTHDVDATMDAIKVCRAMNAPERFQ